MISFGRPTILKSKGNGPLVATNSGTVVVTLYPWRRNDGDASATCVPDRNNLQSLEDLAERFRSGEHGVWDELYLQGRRPVLSMARRQINIRRYTGKLDPFMDGEAAAQDLAQETWIKIYKSLPMSKSQIENFPKWVKTIMRRTNFRMGHDLRLESDLEVSNQFTDPDKKVMIAEIFDVIYALPSPEKEILICYHEGWPDSKTTVFLRKKGHSEMTIDNLRKIRQRCISKLKKKFSKRYWSTSEDNGVE
jgi:DNA-directed RNA polymerase specialized sigma24 family protein